MQCLQCHTDSPEGAKSCLECGTQRLLGKRCGIRYLALVLALSFTALVQQTSVWYTAPET